MKTHRREPSMFEDRDWKVLLPFECIRRFALDCMHLVDGGAIKDFLEILVITIKNATVMSTLEEIIEWMNKFIYLEQSRKLRYMRIVIKIHFILFHFYYVGDNLFIFGFICSTLYTHTHYLHHH